ncbi:unnamed protein product [Colias eurytheme]|nr:unnamed protein product [Colias eurytheme]
MVTCESEMSEEKKVCEELRNEACECGGEGRCRGGGAAVRRARPTRRPPSSGSAASRRSRSRHRRRDAVRPLAAKPLRNARDLNSRANPHETE